MHTSFYAVEERGTLEEVSAVGGALLGGPMPKRPLSRVEIL